MNWIIDERPRFKCSECNSYNEAIQPICPHCGASMIIPKGQYTKYRARFGMNGGCRKESYDILLTKEEYEKAWNMSDPDLYMYIVTEMEDRIVYVYIDTGTDYEGLCGEIEEAGES